MKQIHFLLLWKGFPMYALYYELYFALRIKFILKE